MAEEYKMTKLGEIPVEWDIFRIQDLLDKGYIVHHIDGNHGSLYPKSNEFVESGIPYISANCIGNGRVKFELAKYLLPERASKFKKGVAINGDVLFAHNATVGPVALLITHEEYVILSTSLTLFRCDIEKISPSYLTSYLSSPAFKNQYERIMGQTTRNQVPITTQRELYCILPSLKEQIKIAEIISSVDTQIEQTEQLIEKTKELKKGLMHQLLTKGIGHTEFKQSEIGEIPKEWNVLKIEDIASVNTGNKDTQDKIENGEYPFYVRSQTVERIDSYSYDGEAILTAGDGVGVGKVFHYVTGKFDYHQRVYKISDFQEVIGRFLYYFFSENFYSQVRKYNAKTSVDSVRREMITKMLIPIPSITEQQKIAEILSTVDAEIDSYEQEKAKYEELKKGLMQQLLTGKIRVKVDA